MVAMYFVRSRLNEGMCRKMSKTLFVLSYNLFGLVLSEEKIFGQSKTKIRRTRLHKNHSCDEWFQLPKWLKRKSKCEMLRATKMDGRKVKAITHMTLCARETIKVEQNNKSYILD